MNKFLQRFSFLWPILLICISSCTTTDNQPKTTQEESTSISQESLINLSGEEEEFKSLLDAYKGITKLEEPPKGQNWQGKWFFTIQQKDRHLNPGMVISYALLDTKTNTILANTDREVKPELISPEKVVYVGLTELGEKESYDIITNARNKRLPLKLTKVDSNNLEWELLYDGSAGGSLQSSQIFKTKATYNPSDDTLSGKTEFALMKTVGDNEYKLIPMGYYEWKAMRINDEAFNSLGKEGNVDKRLPIYLVGVNTQAPEIISLLKEAKIEQFKK
ncbi:MAG: hypothetical protein SFT81_02555 [Candidatus Caenarcaniphilales bacterium]|nr:hypothetical protein [Candidatus Caenarcaniphilales bacterium]